MTVPLNQPGHFLLTRWNSWISATSTELESHRIEAKYSYFKEIPILKVILIQLVWVNIWKPIIN